MADFLNTKALRQIIESIIKTAEKELIILSPYIQTNNHIIDLLKQAEERGVETTIIYKEKNVNDFEKAKLADIDNLNLLYHPNLHCKCYYNEKYLVIGSMNLYDFSQRNNREMGVLFRRVDETASDLDETRKIRDDESIFQDTIREIKAIISSAEFEKESRETKSIGFEMNIMKTEYDLVLDKCNLHNKYSKNKRFEPFQVGENWYCRCENFLDKIDLLFEGNRVALSMDFEEKRVIEIFKELNTKNCTNKHIEIDCFRFFWNSHKSPIRLYPLKGHKTWAINDQDEFSKQLFFGLNEVAKKLNPALEKTKK